MLAISAPGIPPWAQILISIVEVLAYVGVAATFCAVLPRYRRETYLASCLARGVATALDQLEAAVMASESELSTVDDEIRAASQEIDKLEALANTTGSLLLQWRAAILAPDTTIEHIRLVVRNGGPPPAG